MPPATSTQNQELMGVTALSDGTVVAVEVLFTTSEGGVLQN
jgi:hypothetical protein